MDIRILQLLEGASQATGLTVVIDVFRAFSLACYIVEKGIEKYYVTSDINVAYNFKKLNNEFVLVGERNERIPPGFDYGNSPTHILSANLNGKIIMHTTSAGTQGLVRAAISAQEVITGSFVNASAIAKYIIQQQPDVVSLVCMGYAARYPTEEDTLCAEYIKSLILGQKIPIDQQINNLKSTSGRRLFLPENQLHSPASDFDYCTVLNRFNFVLKAVPFNSSSYFFKNITDSNKLLTEKCEILELIKIPVV
ncbi:MAG: 2-phosphosulfolactate phosphatase [Bacteroidales bacterium]|nr:2-phosphosulfolactate phosphatase [Bacteroidales bacterium]